MDKVVILYQSRYGSTKKYAQWLQEKLGCTMMETKSAKLQDVMQYDTIILGGGIYVNTVAGISFLRKHIEKLKNKRILVFAVGAAPKSEEYIQAVEHQNLKGLLQGIPFYYCRGEWNEEVLNLKDKTMINMFKKMLAKKDLSSLPTYEVEMIDSLTEQKDWTDPSYLEPIIESL